MARQIEFDRNEVLDRAMQLFWQNGFARTRTRDLTAATGIRESSLYNSFGSKRALFLQAMQRYERRTAEKMRVLAEGRSPRETLEAIWHWLARAASSPAHHGCMLMNAAGEMADEDPAVRQQVHSAYTALEDRFCDLIREGQASGEINRNKQARQIARFLIVSFQGLNAATALRPDQSSMMDVSQLTLSVLD